MKKINLLDRGCFQQTSCTNCLQGYIRIRLDTNSFVISYKNSYIGGYYPHVGITAQCGLSMHFKEREYWYPFDCFKNLDGKSYNVDLSPYINNNIEYDLFISGPIIGGWEKLEIAIPDDCNCSPVYGDFTILFLGGPITYGAGLTSAGDMLTNMTARNYGCNVRQLSFEENDFLQKIAISLDNAFVDERIDVVCVELDHARQSTDSLNQIFKVLDWIEKRKASAIVWNCTAKKSLEKDVIYKKLVSTVNIKDFSYLYRDLKYVDMCTFIQQFY